MTGRDGFTTSLWQATSEPYLSSSVISTQKEFDIIITGGGITGLSTALKLQQAGLKCLLLEARNLCYGTTGGTTAHINTFFDTPYSSIQQDFGKEQAKQVHAAAVAALETIKQNIREYGIDCGFEHVPAYIYAENKEQEKQFEDILSSGKEVGLDIAETNELPAPHSFLRVLKINGQARFHPVRYVYGLAKAFESIGGTILQQCRLTNVKTGDRIEAETTQGTFIARKLIYATHTLPGINLLHLRLVPYRSYAMAVELKDDQYPTPLYYDLQEPYHYFRTQEIDGKRYLIAGGKDHKTGEEENTNKQFRELEAIIRKSYAVKEITHNWSSQYYEPADGLPYIGHLPGFSDNIYVATGFGGNGMTYSGIAAQVLTDMLTRSGESQLGSLFSPGRIKPVAGFTEFVTHNAHVALNFLGKLLPSDRIDGLSELAPGEGRVVKLDNNRLGIYKDEGGKVYAVNTACTHMKCSVKWNSAERSWDCPCHGARFSISGEVLNAPADLPLERIELDKE